MRVKIGDSWYASDDVAICVQFTAIELDCAAQLLGAPDHNQLKFGAFPDDFGDRQAMMDFMEVPLPI